MKKGILEFTSICLGTFARKLFCGGACQGRWVGAAPAVTFLALDLLYSLALKHLEQSPSGLVEPLPFLCACLGSQHGT